MTSNREAAEKVHDSQAILPEHRRDLRDLVALATLPALWVGSEPDTIVDSLVDALFQLLRLDAAYAWFEDRQSGWSHGFSRFAGEGSDEFLSVARKAAVMLPAETSLAVQFGGASMQVNFVRVAAGTVTGIFASGSFAADFPTPGDLLRLRLAGNQAAIGVRSALFVSELKKANSVKDEILALVSHELRTPMTMLKGNAEVLVRRDNIADEDRQSALTDIADQANRLHEIIENMLLLARVEHDTTQELEPINVSRVVQAIVQQERNVTPRRDISLTIENDVVPVVGHELYIRQIVSNLVSNARKYGGGKPIDVILSRAEEQVHVTVGDRGPGISDHDLQNVFDPFFRATRHATRVPGIGLGLTVSRRLAREQKGTLYAAHREGGGTLFTLTLPVARIEQPELD